MNDEALLKCLSSTALCSFPPVQILVYRLPDEVLHGSLCVVGKPLERRDLPRKQIGWVSLCDLDRAFLGSHDEIVLWPAGMYSII